MNSKKNPPSSNRSPAVVLAVLTGILVVGAFVIWPAKRVELDNDSYKRAIALYTICNQRNEERLDEFQLLLDQGDNEQSVQSESDLAIRSIIDQARAGNWTSAMESCHSLIDQQTVH